jgi:hypothetical protein
MVMPTRLAVGFGLKPSDQSQATTTLQDVAGLTADVKAGKKYVFEAFIVWSSSLTTTGIRLDMNGPAIGAGRVTWKRETDLSGAAGTDQTEQRTLTAYQSDAATASVDAAGARRVAGIRGVLENGANDGTLAVQFAAGTADSVTVHAGSWLRVYAFD